MSWISSREIVAHCRSGKRSAEAVGMIFSPPPPPLRKAGFRKILNLKGGILAWSDEVDSVRSKVLICFQGFVLLERERSTLAGAFVVSACCSARVSAITLCDSGEKMATTKITVKHNGSIRVEGDFEIVDPEGKPFGLAGRTAISLCRCGHSATSLLRWLA